MSGSPCRTLSLAEGRFYEPLNSEVDEIRLLEDIHLHKDGAISCRLRSYPLRDAPAYVALSYTWGRFDSSLTIRVNGVAVPVRKNLLRFLKQAGHGHLLRRRPLFVDAICINQDDESERSQQVQLMAKIYGTAEEVAAWLGPAYASSDLALRTIESNNPGTLQKAWWGPAGVAICHLCNRAYWTRLWILQEIVLARSVILHCGKVSIPYEALEAFLLYLWTPLDRGRSNAWYDSTSSGPASALVKQVREARGEASLFTQMSLSRTLGCSEVRDRAYALLGIARFGSQNIRPDYTIGLTDLMNTILRDELAMHPPRSLKDIFSYCKTLVALFNTDLETLFTLPPSSTDIEAIKSAWPAHKENNTISYWWLTYWKHSAVDLWTEDYRHSQGSGKDRIVKDFKQMMFSADLIAMGFLLDAGLVDVNCDLPRTGIYGRQPSPDPDYPPIPKFGRQPALLFAWRECEGTVLDFLLKRPELDVNATDSDNHTLLSAVIMEGSQGLPSLITLLDREDIDIHAGASERGDSLAEAIFQGVEHTTLLLQHPQTDKKALISFRERALRGEPMPVLYYTVSWIVALSEYCENEYTGDYPKEVLDLNRYNGKPHHGSMALLHLLLQNNSIDVNEIFSPESLFVPMTALDVAEEWPGSDLRQSVCELLRTRGALTARELKSSGGRTLLELRGKQVRDRLRHEQRFQLGREAILDTRATTRFTKPVGSFADLGCRSEMIQAANIIGLERPTVIQRSILSALTQGKNVVLRASQNFLFASALAMACIEKINARSRTLQVLVLHSDAHERRSFQDWLLALDIRGTFHYSKGAVRELVMASMLPHIFVVDEYNMRKFYGLPEALDLSNLELVVFLMTSSSASYLEDKALDFSNTRVPESAQLIFITTDLDFNFTEAMDKSRADNTVDITIASR